ncbi:MAG: SpoIIE family protein phosphatase [Chitinispirillaceae bacterium]|nr:SpoIIE family protein phosphatase [Chitinispirillaceae bacterium]
MNNPKRAGKKTVSAVDHSDDSTVEALTAKLAKTRAALDQLQRKAAAIENLEQERDMLHLLLDHSRDAIYFKDLKSRYLRISRGHPALQYIDSPEKGIGKTDFDYFPVEHAQEAFDDEMRIIANGEPVLGIIERETAPGMPEKWVFTSKLPMRDKNGEIVGTFGISRDITQIKQYENELQRAKDELEERVRIRTEDLQSANSDLQRRIAQLDFLTSVSYEMAQCVGIQDLAAVILKSFSSRLKQSIASLCTTSNGKFSCICATGLLGEEQYKTASEQAIPLLHADTLTRPAIIGKWFDILPRSAPWADLRLLPCYITIPLLADNRLIGIVQLFAEEGTDQRFLEEEKVILTLAAHAAVSLSNAIYYKELGEKAQLQGELEAARNIQQRLTPGFRPSIPRVNLKGLYSPAYEVGGDYLDYFKNETGCWVVVIADVCGKGIPAALLMTMLRSAFRVEANRETSAKQLLCSVNTTMQVNLDDRSFVTAICLIISSDGTSMSYARAGHPRLIRISAGSNHVETFDSDGVALGILSEDESFAETIDELTIPLNPGDRFFIYTDGLTEAFNLQKNPYTTKRLLKLLESDIGTSPEAVLNAIIHDIKAFTQGAPYHDDLTMIAMEVQPDGQV